MAGLSQVKMKGGPALHAEVLSLVLMPRCLSQTNSPEAPALKCAGNDPTMSYILETILRTSVALSF